MTKKKERKREKIVSRGLEQGKWREVVLVLVFACLFVLCVFMCMSILAACMSVWCGFAWSPERPEEAVRSPLGSELQMFVPAMWVLGRTQVLGMSRFCSPKELFFFFNGCTVCFASWKGSEDRWHEWLHTVWTHVALFVLVSLRCHIKVPKKFFFLRFWGLDTQEQNARVGEVFLHGLHGMLLTTKALACYPWGSGLHPYCPRKKVKWAGIWVAVSLKKAHRWQVSPGRCQMQESLGRCKSKHDRSPVPHGSGYCQKGRQ